MNDTIPCLPASEPATSVPPRSIVVAASCGHRVWVSPHTVRSGRPVVCADCVRREHQIVTAQMIERALEAVR